MSLPVNPQPSPAQQGPATSSPMSALTTESSSVLDATQIANLVKLLQKGDPVAPEVAQQLQAIFTVQGATQHPIPHPPHQIPVPHTAFPPGQGIPGINDPGPSSHPRGPPNLGQLSAAAAAALPTPAMPPGPPVQEADDLAQDPEDPDKSKTGSMSGPGSGRTRGNRTAAMGTDEWARQRKDNHKEVERRRRGNINEGINELGRIVPNSSGEKAKGAILARAVQYIHHLKENEARNIEKWTLEKLLMDQAMGDLQAQLEDMRRLWEEERAVRQRAETELEVLRGVPQGTVVSAVGAPSRPTSSSHPVPADFRPRAQSTEKQEGAASTTEARIEIEPRSEEGGASESADRPGKRPRVE